MITITRSGFGETVPLNDLRKAFHTAVLNADLIPVFVNQVKMIENPTPLELAYKAAAEALIAQEEWNPIEKLARLKKSQKLLSRAIEQDIDDIEIRFLRFGIQYNIPHILGLSDDMKDDKSLIIEGVSKLERFEIDEFFSTYILTLLHDSGLWTPDEISMVKSKIELPSIKNNFSFD